MQRVLLIANKNWEAEPILNALLNKNFRPGELNDPHFLNFPQQHQQGDPFPRAIWEFVNFRFELWCIENIMSPNPNEQNKEYYSSSEQKYLDLKKIFNYSKMEISLVVAIGTAGFPSELSRNGGIAIGSEIFIFDGHPDDDNPVSKWHDQAYFGKLIPSVINDLIFQKINTSLQQEINQFFFEKRMLATPLNPAIKQEILASKKLAALSNVNVTDYKEYKIMDKKGLAAFEQVSPIQFLGSVETTHAVIRVHAGNLPFMFISSIVDRLGYFDIDVGPKEFAQNYAGSFNAGICIGWLIPLLETNL